MSLEEREGEMNIFGKSSLNLTFGQDNNRKSDFARQNSGKPILLEISENWRFYI